MVVAESILAMFWLVNGLYSSNQLNQWYQKFGNSMFLDLYDNFFVEVN